jgi:nucleotide-binding universal stress UspA family protein
MKILCATDFSSQAERAARAAVQLARCLGDSVVLAHVTEPPLAQLLELHGTIDHGGLQEALRSAAERALDDQAAPLRSHGVSVQTKLLRGVPNEALTVYAKEIQARMIVMGTHGRHAPWRWFVGSVAERTQCTADRPVLVIRERADGLGLWAHDRRPLRVLVGIDPSRTSHAPVEWVKALREAGPCQITFVHASRPFAYQPAGDVLALLDRELRRKIAELEGAQEVSLRIVPNWNSDAETLVHYAAAEKMDLLIVGTHQRRGLNLLVTGSVARDLVRLSNVPVLTVPTISQLDRQPLDTPRLHTILAVTDLSKEGNRTAPLAFAMARPGGTVVLCHVRKGQEPDDESLEKDLRSLIPVDAFARGVHAEVIVRREADLEIIARDVHANLIVTAGEKGRVECALT